MHSQIPTCAYTILPTSAPFASEIGYLEPRFPADGSAP